MAQERPSFVKDRVSPALYYLGLGVILKGGLDLVHFPTPFPSVDADILGGLALYGASMYTSRFRPKEDALSLGLLAATGLILGGSLVTHLAGDNADSSAFLTMGELAAGLTSVYKTVQRRHQFPQARR